MTEQKIHVPLPKNAPAVILIEPQMGENIGMAARAMLNCGMSDLRLVRPREGWPNGKAIQTSSNAVEVIDAVRVFDTTAEAIADIQYVIATTARERHMVKTVHTPETGATEMHNRALDGQSSALMFGPERAGLENDDIAKAQAVLHVPLNPNYSSLNLAQAVLLVGYAWYSTRPQDSTEAVDEPAHEPATQDQLEFSMQFLMDHLEKSDFFLNPDKRPHTERNIRNMFLRADMTAQETQTLNGMIKAIATRYKA